jgi:protoheme IX farnesyltransferase
VGGFDALLGGRAGAGSIPLPPNTAEVGPVAARPATGVARRAPGQPPPRPGGADPGPARPVGLVGRVGTSGPRPAVSVSSALARLAETVSAYLALTKPRIVELLLITTVPAMLLAARRHGTPIDLGWLGLVLATLVGGALGAGAANTLNCVLDRDIDAVMNRTRRRPIPSGRVRTDRAAAFAIILGLAAAVELAVLVNVLAAVLTIGAALFYVVVYTAVLKRRTPQNIVIGGAAGALPPVIGWAGVTNDLSPTAILLFLIVFWWTPPHFWALSLGLVRDYARAGVPMLPVVRGVPETRRQIVRYSLGLVAVTLALWFVAGMGPLYGAVAVGLGARFIVQARRLDRDGTPAGAMRLYHASIAYLAALFAAIAVDALLFAS